MAVPTRARAVLAPPRVVRSPTTGARHPERPARIVALEARDGAPRPGSAATPRDAPDAPRERCSSRPPGRVRRRSSSSSAPRRRRADRLRHGVDAPRPGRRRATARAARVASSTPCSAAAGRRRLRRRMRPPGHHAEPRSGDGLLPLRQRRGRRAAGARRVHGLQRVLILDWDVHHGNGTNDDLPRRPTSVLFVSIHEWPLYPGTGPASRRRAPGAARATR